MKLCRVCGRCYEDSETVCRSSDGSPLVPDRPGDCIIAGKFRLKSLLGRGGVGSVYVAEHIDLEIPVALKLLLPALTDDPVTLARFRREAQSAARLHHPGIARTHDFGILPDGGAYIVMELVEGPTLRKFITDFAPLKLIDAVRIARQVLEAIDAAHTAGIVHRDLKPSNIIIAQDHRDHQRATVVDFGLAKVTGETLNIHEGITTAGMFLGTPRYMSPEQCEGKELDARSDIYSLGIILYEMLAGHPPFDAPSVTAIALKHLQEPPPPIRQIREEIPDDLEEAIDDALAKDPSDRPSTAGELAERLRSIEQRLASEGEPGTALPAALPSVVSTPVSHPTPELTGPATIGMSGAPVPVPVPPPAPTSTTAPMSTPAQTSTSPPTRQASGTIDPVVPGARLSPLEGKFRPREEEATASRSSLLPVAAIAALLLLGLTGWWLIERDGSEPATAERTTGSVAEPAREEHDPASPQQTPSERLPSQKTPSRASTTPKTPASTPPAFDRATVTDELQQGIARWIATMNARNVDGHLALYDSRLSAFYLQRNVDRDRVRAEKAQLMKSASSVRTSTGPINLMINRDGEGATMRFPKIYTITQGGSERSGEVISELIWKRTPDGWRIVSERDLRVVR